MTNNNEPKILRGEIRIDDDNVNASVLRDLLSAPNPMDRLGPTGPVSQPPSPNPQGK